MKSVPIDKLLQWTINDELPKGHHVMQNVVRIIDRAATADRHRGTPYIPPGLTVQIDQLTGCYLGGLPHPDAVTIAKAVYRFGRPCGLPENSIRALLGPLAELDPQAILAGCGVRPDVAALMITCAVLKRPPHLRLDHPRPCPTYRLGDRRRITTLRLDVDGDLVDANVRNWQEKERAAWYGEPRCPLSWEDPSIETVAEQRAEYTIWWRALMFLQRQLVGELGEHEALALDIPASPWGSPPRPTGRTFKPLAPDRPTPKVRARPARSLAMPSSRHPPLGGAIPSSKEEIAASSTFSA